MLFGTLVSDVIYCELVYNGGKNELYFDAYKTGKTSSLIDC